jgi:hypothetical protein
MRCAVVGLTLLFASTLSAEAMPWGSFAAASLDGSHQGLDYVRWHHWRWHRWHRFAFRHYPFWHGAQPARLAPDVSAYSDEQSHDWVDPPLLEHTPPPQ